MTKWCRVERFRTLRDATVLPDRRLDAPGELPLLIGDRVGHGVKELGRRKREPGGRGQPARPNGGRRAVGRAAQLRQRHSACGGREHRGCGQGKHEPFAPAARLRFARGPASNFSLACWRDLAPKGRLELGRAARCARASGRLTALMVLLKLPQDLVALNVVDGWTIASDRPLDRQARPAADRPVRRPRVLERGSRGSRRESGSRRRRGRKSQACSTPRCGLERASLRSAPPVPLGDFFSALVDPDRARGRSPVAHRAYPRQNRTSSRSSLYH